MMPKVSYCGYKTTKRAVKKGSQKGYKKGSQIDIAVLDFSKAFDTVPHDGLFSKLKHYGIDKHIWQWISNFLKKT